MKQKNYLFLGISSFTAIIIVWLIITQVGLIKPFFLPPPLDILKAGFRLFSEENFLKDVLVSLSRILVGFLIATVLAIPLGILVGLNRKVEALIEPVIDFIRYTPIPAFIPLFILWFGIGEQEKIIIIVASVFFQLTLMVANSVSSVPKEMIEFAKILGARKIQIVLKVILGYSKPRIFDDLRISMGWAWSGLIIAEIVGASAGLGYAIIQAQRLLKTADVFLTIIIIGILGLLFDAVFKYLQKISFPWYKKEKI